MTYIQRNDSQRLLSLIDAFGNYDKKVDKREVDQFRGLVTEGDIRGWKGFDGFKPIADVILPQVDRDPSRVLNAPHVGAPTSLNFRYGDNDRISLTERIDAYRLLVANPKVFTPVNAAHLIHWLERDLAWASSSALEIKPEQAKACFDSIGAFVRELEERVYGFGAEYTADHQSAIVAANRLRSYLGDYLLLRYPEQLSAATSTQPAFVPRESDGTPVHPVHFHVYDPSFNNLRSFDDFPDVFVMTTDAGDGVGQAIRRVTQEDAYESHLALVVRGRDKKLYVVEAGNGHGAEATPLDLFGRLKDESRIQFHFLNDAAFANPEAKKAFFDRAKDYIDVIGKTNNPYDFALGHFEPPAPGEKLEITKDTPLMCANLVQAFMYWAPIDAYADDQFRSCFGVVHKPTGQKVVGLTPFLAPFDQGAGVRKILDDWKVKGGETVMPASAHNPLFRTVAEARNLDGTKLKDMQIDNAINAFLVNELLNKRDYVLVPPLKASIMTNLIYGLHALTLKRLLPFEGQAMTRPVIETFLAQSQAAEPFRQYLQELNAKYEKEHGYSMSFYQLRAATQEAYDDELRARLRGEDVEPSLTSCIHPAALD
ncbi:MAG: hypothetical protein IPK13_06185 [Deltaproteobacteria bacterium]|nr:hypothetical protein [Deltaproteobacteria bacterium]